jgi:hypothetical protein
LKFEAQEVLPHAATLHNIFLAAVASLIAVSVWLRCGARSPEFAEDASHRGRCFEGRGGSVTRGGAR